jgi:hypothetical protein
MTLYNVHIYREMRLVYEGVEAETHEAAATIARDKPTGDADGIDDCEGESFSALVDVQGDEDYAQSRMIDFETERQRKAARKLLAALESLADQADEDCPEEHRSRHFRDALEEARDAIADAEAAGIVPEPAAPTLRDALQAVLPYAWSEHASLRECWKRDGDPKIKEELEACDRALDQADRALAQARAAGIPPALATSGTATVGQESPRFEIEHDPEEYPDRVHVTVDGKFEVTIVRTDEGVVADIRGRHGDEAIASTWASDSEAKAEEPDGDAPASHGASGGVNE